MTRRAAEPTLAEVEHALTVIADVIKMHPAGRAAVPISVRLERERERLRAEEEALQRAIGRSAAPTPGAAGNAPAAP